MRWVVLIGILLSVVAAALFAIQNSSRTTQLSLDLGVVAWQLQQPVQVPALIGGTLLVGVLLGAAPVAYRSLKLSARIRELEANAAMSQALGKDPARKEPGSW